jgi:hypothetical protein
MCLLKSKNIFKKEATFEVLFLEFPKLLVKYPNIYVLAGL